MDKRFALRNYVLVSFLACMLTSCGGFVYKKEIANGYYLIAIDSDEQMALGRKSDSSYITVIPETIFAIGWDESFIIAKQHPRTSSFPQGYKVNKDETFFYLLRIKDDQVFGPMPEPAYLKKRNELRVDENLSFTKVFSNLQ